MACSYSMLRTTRETKDKERKERGIDYSRKSIVCFAHLIHLCSFSSLTIGIHTFAFTRACILSITHTVHLNHHWQFDCPISFYYILLCMTNNPQGSLLAHVSTLTIIIHDCMFDLLSQLTSSGNSSLDPYRENILSVSQ